MASYPADPSALLQRSCFDPDGNFYSAIMAIRDSYYPANAMLEAGELGVCQWLELELDLIQAQMAQDTMLRQWL